MFPPHKKVSFRAPLTEEIKTEVYTMAHSDLQSSSSTVSTLQLSVPEKEDTKETAKPEEREDERQRKDSLLSSAQTGEKRESSDEEDSDTCPATPVAGRRKRHRQWVWTLGPLDKASEVQRSEDAGLGEEKAEGT